MRNDPIKDHWERQGNLFPDSHQASWGDEFCISLEINEVKKHLVRGETLLDIGCANGLSTMKYLEAGVSHSTGVDFSENMISAAKRNCKAQGLDHLLSFHVGDIRNLDFESGAFGTTNITRVLINLPTWEEQVAGLDESLRVTKSGGVLILSEGFYEPLVRLNGLRSFLGLQPLREHEFNYYLSTNKLETYLRNKGLSFSCKTFSSTYYLGTRVIRDLILEKEQVSDFKNSFNEVFLELQKRYTIDADLGIQKLYIVKCP